MVPGLGGERNVVREGSALLFLHFLLGSPDCNPSFSPGPAMEFMAIDLGIYCSPFLFCMEVLWMKITPSLPLDQWREEIGYHPWHFWGISDVDHFPLTSKCNSLVYEYGWQMADQAGRDDIRKAIMDAEQILYDNLNYWPAPVYTEATFPWPKYQDVNLFRNGRMDPRGNWISVQLNEGMVQAIGVETLTLIQAGAALVWSDEDGDGVQETFTITQATSVTDPDEIAIYFATADRLDEDDELSARWRIEPVHVRITGGNAVIKGKRWLCVKPTIYQVAGNTPINPMTAASFITTADVYRKYTKMDGLNSTSDSQSALIWESKPCCWGCTNPANSTDPASEGWVTGRSGIRNAESGLVTAAEAVYDVSTGTWASLCDCTNACGEPDKVLIRYLAGMPLDFHGWMAKNMRTLVSRLACAEMTRRICACDTANREWSNWQQDVSRTGGPEEYQINLDALNNPLGTRRGHIWAWNQIKGLARVVGQLA